MYTKTTSSLFFTLLISFAGPNSSTVITTRTTLPNSAGKIVASNFDWVEAHGQQKGVALSWTIFSTQGLLGFVIERSYDGIYYDEIDLASCTGSCCNNYNDNAVYPGYLYYRITAIMEDGSTETSETKVVRIVSRK